MLILPGLIGFGVGMVAWRTWRHKSQRVWLCLDIDPVTQQRGWCCFITKDDAQKYVNDNSARAVIVVPVDSRSILLPD